MKKHRKLIIVGDSSFAQVAYEYFTHDSCYEVHAFSVEKAYLKTDFLFGVPIVPFEELMHRYNPDDYDVFVATVYTKLNRLRTRLYRQIKQWGYKCASYVSSRAFVWPNVVMGEHCFIFENNVIQPFVQMGNNIILWSGNHIGHHSIIEDNCFISSHVVVSGHCMIGSNSFLGVNCTISNQITVGQNSLIGAGALILKNTPPNTVYKGQATEPHAISSIQLFKIPTEEIDDEMA